MKNKKTKCPVHGEDYVKTCMRCWDCEAQNIFEEERMKFYDLGYKHGYEAKEFEEKHNLALDKAVELGLSKKRSKK